MVALRYAFRGHSSGRWGKLKSQAGPVRPVGVGRDRAETAIRADDGMLWSRERRLLEIGQG
jgi:hypothetical protein